MILIICFAIIINFNMMMMIMVFTNIPDMELIAQLERSSHLPVELFWNECFFLLITSIIIMIIIMIIMIIMIIIIIIIIIDPQPVDLLPSTLAEYEAALPDLPRDRVLAIFR